MMMRYTLAAAAIAASAVAACTPAAAPVSLAGAWKGEITCYAMASPLQVAIDAATPEKASVGMGDNGALTWDATVTFDAATRAVAINSVAPTGDAQTIAGTLSADGDAISGSMEKQLCTTFSLARQK